LDAFGDTRTYESAHIYVLKMRISIKAISSRRARPDTVSIVHTDYSTHWWWFYQSRHCVRVQMTGKFSTLESTKTRRFLNKRLKNFGERLWKQVSLGARVE